jgi:hypothetical protein
MATVLVNDGRVGWLANRDKLVDALDRLGWEETFYNGHQARLEPDHFSPSKPPYAVLCERVDAIAADFDDADYEFVWSPNDELWVWRVL